MMRDLNNQLADLLYVCLLIERLCVLLHLL